MPARKQPWRAAAITAVALGVVAVGGWSGAASPAPIANPADPELVALGEQVYAQQCASCHGADLEGQPDWQRQLPDGGLPAPPHDASGHTWHHPDVLLFGITKFGGQALAPAGFKSNMPAFADQLSDREIWAVLAFIKSRWPADIRAAQQQRNKIQN
jgi:mono/diheme cytochrome c family protein